PADVYPLSLHDALPIWRGHRRPLIRSVRVVRKRRQLMRALRHEVGFHASILRRAARAEAGDADVDAEGTDIDRADGDDVLRAGEDRKSTRLNSSHLGIS